MTKKVLITGIPGTGKTHIGKTLEEQKGFRHVDMEHRNIQIKIQPDPNLFFNELIKTSDNIVITWGFGTSSDSINLINTLKAGGFKLIWFDGDRESARREFIKRETAKDPENLVNSIAALNAQINAINESQVISLINPIIINTFNEQREFKTEMEIINEIPD